jgi:hypothetical protein
MSKLNHALLFLTLGLAVVSCLYADGYLADENTLKWGVGPDPENQPDGQLWYTFSDWTWVEGSFALDSAWEGDPATQPWPGEFVPQTHGLQIRAENQVVGSTVDPAGYEFDLASAGISGKVISSVKVINSYWNFPSGVNSSVAASFYDEDDKLVYTENPVTMSVPWWQGTVVDFSHNPTKRVKFVLTPYAATWVWAGNFMYIEQLEITLIDEADAECGTKYNPYPPADLNGDCEVDSSDIQMLAKYWLDCNDPADVNCGR